MIPKDFIEEMVSRANIDDIVGSAVTLKRSGKTKMGLCPFHGEKTPSFFVYPDTQSFYCFGCGAGGDCITFIKQYYNLDYLEALAFLAEKLGMVLPTDSTENSNIRSRVYEINKLTARYFYDCLNSDSGKEAREYIHSRGLTKKLVNHFGIGYAKDEYDALSKHLRSNGYSVEEMLAAGVLKKGDSYNYDAFRDRIMFPIIDQRGKVIAFGGRRLRDKGPKYLNSSDTPVFKKSRGLFALNFAKNVAQKNFILCEGYMDVVSLHGAGFETAVATLGTAISSEQAKLLSLYADRVCICYDSDEAGQKATKRAIEVLEKEPIKVQVVNIPDAKDPDEYILKFGKDKFAQLLTQGDNAIEFRLSQKKQNKNLANADGKASYIKEAVEVLAQYGVSETEREIYAGRIEQETGISKTSIIRQLKSKIVSMQKSYEKTKQNDLTKTGAFSRVKISKQDLNSGALNVVYAEQQLVAAIIKNANMLKTVQNELIQYNFVSAEMGEIYNQIIQLNSSGTPLDYSLICADLQDKTVALCSKILASVNDVVLTKDDVELYLARMKKTEKQNNTTGEMSDDEHAKYLEELRRKKTKERVNV